MLFLKFVIIIKIKEKNRSKKNIDKYVKIIKKIKTYLNKLKKRYLKSCNLN